MKRSSQSLKRYFIDKHGRTWGTLPERNFDAFQRSIGLGLVMNVSLPFNDDGRPYDFQLDFARPTDESFNIDFEIDGKAYHSSDRQARKDHWKDEVKNRQGLKVIHVPAILTERHWWEYLEKEITRALLSKEGTIYIEA